MSKQLFMLSALVTSLALSIPSRALDIGLEASARVELSDNVDQFIDGEEEDGQIGFLSLEVYGEQQSRFLQAGFSGELQTRRVLDDSDDDASTLNNFFGGATLLISPTVSWYIGDVLGSVRVGDGILPTDDDESERRNVFVTGPTFDIDIDSVREFNAELLYFNQDQDDRDLAQLFTAQFEFRQDIGGGNTLGLLLTDIYTDEQEPEEGEVLASDSNRVSAAVFWERDRGLVSWFAEAGATQFSIDGDSISGANLGFRATRRLTAASSLEFSIGTDLSDQNISAIDSLLDDGIGVENEAAGIFQSNVASLIYNFNGTRTSYQVGTSIEDVQFETLQALVTDTDPTLEDSIVISVFGSLARPLTTRLSLNAAIRYENERFDNLEDVSDSVAGDIRLNYQINRSFSLGVGARTSFATGIDTRDFINTDAEGDFDITESRAVLELRWAPPSRATREPVAQLRQLLR